MEQKPNLDETKTDLVVSLAKGALGAVPVVGGIVAEVIGTLIPRQRTDRIAEFVEILGEQVKKIDRDVLDQKMKTAEFIDLFEDGAWQAVRSLTRERKEKIAAVLKHSLYGGELSYIQEKELLSLLNELNDVQLIILKAKATGYANDDEEFYERHREVLQPPSVHLGSEESEFDNAALHRAFVNDLHRLGLLETTFKKPRRNELPEFDLKTGMIKAQFSQITRLGRLLLRYIDVDD